MTSEIRKAFDRWFSKEYESLTEAARNLHPDNFDLVHHTYLAVINASPVDIMRNPAGYFHTSMWINSTRGSFKDLYRIREGVRMEIPSPEDISRKIMKEEALILASHLAWFDRTILELYLLGYNLREISRETGIPHTNLYQSLFRTKKKIRRAIRHRQTTE